MNFLRNNIWLVPIIVTFVILGPYALAVPLFRACSKPRPGEVTGSGVTFGWGVMSGFFAVLVLALGPFVTPDLLSSSQLIAWLSTILTASALAAICCVTQLGVIARHDESGVSFRRITGRWERAEWSDFVAVEFGNPGSWSGPEFSLLGRRPFRISSDSRGGFELLLAAAKAGVPGAKDMLQRISEASD